VAADQNRWQRDEALRAERNAAYTALLTSAAEVRTETNRLLRSCPAAGKSLDLPSSGVCDDSKLLEAVDHLKRSSARIRSVASAEGLAASDGLTAVLPTRSYRFSDGTLHLVDRVRYSVAYESALKSMCLDTRVGSKEACG
jgi:hypothetical protein